MARPENGAVHARAFTLALVVSCIAVIYFAQEVLIPFALAVLLSFMLAPLVTRLEKWNFGRVASVSTVVFGLFIVIGLFGWIVTDQALRLVDNLPAYKKQIVKKARSITPDETGVFGKLRETLNDLSRDLAETPPPAKTNKDVSKENPAEVPDSSELEPIEASDPDLPTADPASDDADSIDPPPKDADRADAKAPVEEPVPVVVQEKTNPFDYLPVMLGTAASALATAGVVILFVFFMLIEREDLRNRLIRLFGPGRLTVTTQAMDDAAQRVSRYLLMQLIVNATYGLTVAVGLYFIGVPNAVLWGLLSAVMRYVPYIGPWIAAVMPILLSLAVFDGWTRPLVTIGLFLVLELVSNNIMEPLLYRSSTGISTIGILVAAVFWTWLWGSIGLVLSTPLTVCIAVLGHYVPQLEFLSVLLSDEEVLTPSSHYYQRLLAEDQDEASEVIEKYFADEQHGERTLYDEVLIPALSLAEQDAHRGALEPGKLRFIQEAIREAMDEASERELARTAAAATAISRDASGNNAAGNNDRGSEPKAADAPSGPCILCLPARDDADEIVADMLSRVLAGKGRCVTTASVKSLAGEMMDLVESLKVDRVFISAVPPFAVTHARYLCKRLKSRFPQLTIVVGLWNSAGQNKKSIEKLRGAYADKVVTTLEEAVAML